MSQYTIDIIKSDVLILLDEYNASDTLLDDEDLYANTLNDMINERIVDAVKQVIARAPLDVFQHDDCTSFAQVKNAQGYLVNRTITWDASDNYLGVGSVSLPDDFFRLIKFKMSDWKRPVFVAISEADEDYAIQRSPYKGVRGNTENPVCAIVIDVQSKRLEFFSCKDKKGAISSALYIPYPSIVDNKIDIPERCYESVIYTIGAMVCFALKQQELGTVLNELSKSSMV